MYPTAYYHKSDQTVHFVTSFGCLGNVSKAPTALPVPKKEAKEEAKETADKPVTVESKHHPVVKAKQPSPPPPQQQQQQPTPVEAVDVDQLDIMGSRDDCQKGSKGWAKIQSEAQAQPATTDVNNWPTLADAKVKPKPVKLETDKPAPTKAKPSSSDKENKAGKDEEVAEGAGTEPKKTEPKSNPPSKRPQRGKRMELWTATKKERYEHSVWAWPC